jgi:hypothetical protein
MQFVHEDATRQAKTEQEPANCTSWSYQRRQVETTVRQTVLAPTRPNLVFPSRLFIYRHPTLKTPTDPQIIRKPQVHSVPLIKLRFAINLIELFTPQAAAVPASVLRKRSPFSAPSLAGRNSRYGGKTTS